MDLIRKIEQSLELFKLEKIKAFHYEGLLYPSPFKDSDDRSPFAYGRPSLGITLYVRQNSDTENEFAAYASIVSIDDSGMTIDGPSESKEKAQERLIKFMLFIESLQFRCPTQKEINNNFKLGMTASLY